MKIPAAELPPFAINPQRRAIRCLRDEIITLDVITLHVTIAKWSVRVNNQFCICFRWMGADTEDVEIVDYH